MLSQIFVTILPFSLQLPPRCRILKGDHADKPPYLVTDQIPTECGLRDVIHSFGVVGGEVHFSISYSLKPAITAHLTFSLVANTTSHLTQATSMSYPESSLCRKIATYFTTFNRNRSLDIGTNSILLQRAGASSNSSRVCTSESFKYDRRPL